MQLFFLKKHMTSRPIKIILVIKNKILIRELIRINFRLTF